MKYVYFGNELYHHGILGQKWGIRRYQNYDGTLINPKKKTSAPLSRSEVNKIVPDANYWDTHNNERVKAAKLGLKALKKRAADYSWIDPNNKDHQSWFIYEDQTYGLLELAKMAQDYDRKTVSKCLDYILDKSNANEISDYNDPNYNEGAANIMYGFNIENPKKYAMQFVDDCYAIKKSK